MVKGAFIGVVTRDEVEMDVNVELLKLKEEIVDAKVVNIGVTEGK